MSKVYFTTIQGIKDNSLIDTNTSEKTLKVVQRTAEAVWLQEVLGTDLYKLLKANILSNSLTTPQRTLIQDYILDYLYALVEMLAVDDLLMKLSDNGVYAPNSDRTLQVQQAQLQQQKTHKVKAVNFTCGLMKEYLEDNIADFPEYNTNIEGVPSKKYNTYGFYCDEDDFEEDNEYYQRRGTNNFEEQI